VRIRGSKLMPHIQAVTTEHGYYDSEEYPVTRSRGMKR